MRGENGHESKRPIEGLERVRTSLSLAAQLIDGTYEEGLGLMALLGIELNVPTIAVAPLIIGLGSDDGIHIMDRLERGEPVDEVLQETGAPTETRGGTRIPRSGGRPVGRSEECAPCLA